MNSFCNLFYGIFKKARISLASRRNNNKLHIVRKLLKHRGWQYMFICIRTKTKDFAQRNISTMQFMIFKKGRH